MSVRIGLSLMPQADFAAAALPLLREGLVDVLEWGPDLQEHADWEPPDWYRALLGHYAGAGALVGHGVSGSPLSVGTDSAFRTWLARVRQAIAQTPITSFSEHFGFCRTASWSRCPPLPLRPDPTTLASGVARLRELRDTLECPVGLENLALALSPSDLDGRGAFLEALLDPVEGFLHLDLHNLWCAAVNFDRDPVRLMERYPLHRVRRLHLSGGSWSSVPGMDRPFRRDTHDDRVPDEVFALLPEALARCPQLEDVILEQLGGTIDAVDFAADFHRLVALVGAADTADAVSPARIAPLEWLPDDPPAADWQDALVNALDSGTDWPAWPADMDGSAAGVGRSLVGRWGRRVTQD